MSKPKIIGVNPANARYLGRFARENVLRAGHNPGIPPMSERERERLENKKRKEVLSDSGPAPVPPSRDISTLDTKMSKRRLKGRDPEGNTGSGEKMITPVIRKRKIRI